MLAAGHQHHHYFNLSYDTRLPLVAAVSVFMVTVVDNPAAGTVILYVQPKLAAGCWLLAAGCLLMTKCMYFQWFPQFAAVVCVYWPSA